MLEPPQHRRDFTIAIICALDVEANAVLHTFDANWSDQGRRYGRAPADDNTYTLGAIGEHHVVLVHMPGMGVTSASTIATNLRHSFPKITLALVVGVCGGVPRGPYHQKDIYLGDLIISTAVVQYDFGRQYPGAFERRKALDDTVGGPNRKIRGLLARLKTQHYSQEMADGIAAGLDRARISRQMNFPSSPGQDLLYEATYPHKHRPIGGTIWCNTCAESHDSICALAVEKDCESLQCDDSHLVDRERNADVAHRPEIHMGKIGSGNSVIKSGQHRDLISERDGVIAFEMEGAGVWESFPTIIVKGVCDYADSHKNKVWQNYAATVAALGTKVLLQQHEPDCGSTDIPDNLPSSKELLTRTASHWLVPFVRDPGYVPRGDLIDQIDNHFGDTTYSPRVSLVGLGGVGKSQVAIEYAYHIKERSEGTSIFWVHASNFSRFNASYQSIARLVQIPGHDDATADQTNLVYEWLQSERSGRWLLIVDNVDDLSLLQPQHTQTGQNTSIMQYLPQRTHGAILITSRDYQVAASLASTYSHIVALGVMSQPEAQELVRHRLPASRGRDDEIAALCDMLDFLPLAITQATAYIARSPTMTVAAYMSIFNADYKDSMRLLSQERIDFRRDWQNVHSVVRTWEMSFTQMQSRNKLAAEILSLMAVFDRQAVPNSLLRGDEKDAIYDEAVDTLLGYAFVTVNAGGYSLSTHRLVQLATRAWLDSTRTWTYWQEQAVFALSRAYPVGEYENWAICQLLEPHVEAALQPSYTANDCEVQLARILNHRSVYYNRRSDFITGRDLARSSTEKRARILGKDHMNTLISALDLAWALSCLGEFREAESILHESLAILKAKKKVEYDMTQSARAQLVVVLNLQQKFHESEHTATEIYEADERTYGLADRRTLGSMTNLAVAKEGVGQLQEAERLYRLVLETREKTYGFGHHLETIRAQKHLALFLSNKGKNREALERWKMASAGYIALFGFEHSDTKYCQSMVDTLTLKVSNSPQTHISELA